MNTKTSNLKREAEGTSHYDSSRVLSVFSDEDNRIDEDITDTEDGEVDDTTSQYGNVSALTQLVSLGDNEDSNKSKLYYTRSQNRVQKELL